MIVHACREDGTSLGEFSEEDFQASVLAGKLSTMDYYWQDGMKDWKPISQYRLLAKTQKISFAPPMRSTIKIDMETVTPPAPKTQNAVSRLWGRIKSKN